MARKKKIHYGITNCSIPCDSRGFLGIRCIIITKNKKEVTCKTCQKLMVNYK